MLLICVTFLYNFRSENSTYRLVHVQKNAEMWNTTFHEHASQTPGCEGFLSWDSLGEEQRGIVWQERARCDKCTYVSRKFKLYEEVETDTTCRGRKTAKANRGLQIGLMQTPIGSCTLRKILLSTNIKPPSTKGNAKNKYRRRSN